MTTSKIIKIGTIIKNIIGYRNPVAANKVNNPIINTVTPFTMFEKVKILSFLLMSKYLNIDLNYKQFFIFVLSTFS
jgi:hypothetical protein